MNQSLKSLVGLAFAVVKVGMDAVAKKALFMDVVSVLEQVPGAVANLGDLPAELAALSQPENEADLAAYVQSQVGVLGASSNVQAVVADALNLVQVNVAGVQKLLADLKAPSA